MQKRRAHGSFRGGGPQRLCADNDRGLPLFSRGRPKINTLSIINFKYYKKCADSTKNRDYA